MGCVGFAEHGSERFKLSRGVLDIVEVESFCEVGRDFSEQFRGCGGESQAPTILDDCAVSIAAISIPASSGLPRQTDG